MAQHIEHHPHHYYTAAEVLNLLARVVGTGVVVGFLLYGANQFDRSFQPQPEPIVLNNRAAAAEVMRGEVQIVQFTPDMAELLRAGTVVKVINPVDKQEKFYLVSSVLTDETGTPIGIFTQDDSAAHDLQVQSFSLAEIIALVAKS